jgi:hypothetical protein
VEREVCSNAAVGLWVGGVRLGHRLSWGFSLFSSVNVDVIPQLPHDLHFITYQSIVQ